VARFDANGNPDLTFGTGREGSRPDRFIGTTSGQPPAIDSSGRIVVAGSARVGTSDDFALARFDASGTLDATFRERRQSSSTRSRTGHDQLYGVAIDASGRIVVAGTGSHGGAPMRSFVVARYDGTGSTDPTFAAAASSPPRSIGQLYACYGRGLVIDAVAVVVAGSSDVTSVVSGLDRHFALARYDGTGNLDPRFGNGGKVVTPIATSATSGNTRVDEGYAIAIDGRGRIVRSPVKCTC
jgi:uncharacterized delta-60 repeat protein